MPSKGGSRMNDAARQIIADEVEILTAAAEGILDELTKISETLNQIPTEKT